MKLNIQLFGLDQWIMNSEGDDVYLRKANQIHGFFLEKGYDDNRQGEQRVSKQDVLELIDRIKQVLANHELAPELLPTTPGFFFGTYEYDDWYFEQLENYLPDIEKLIKPGAKYSYSVWW